MAAEKLMNTSFLDSSKTVKTSSDKRTQTITWDCNPGYVKYNFRVPCNGGYGKIQRKGCYKSDGIYRWDSSKQTYERAGYRHYLWEGVKCTTISYRKNKGKWITNSNPNGLSNDDLKLVIQSSKDDDEYEVKVTYELWTQGYPFRNVPFMRFSRGKTSTIYNTGRSFKDSKPNNPGRVWSGIMCYENDTTNSKAGDDLNSAWNFEEVSWTQPNSNDIKTNWAYLDANGLPEKKENYNKGSWVYGCCQTYKDGMPYVSADMGWTSLSGQKPMKNRRSMWWRYSRTFTSSHKVSVVERPDPLDDPTIKLEVFDNLVITDDKNVLDGTKGKLKLTYSHPQKRAGKYDLYAYQLDGNSFKKTLIISNEDIDNNKTDIVNINFDSLKLDRSKNILYYAVAKVEDTEYDKTRYGYSTGSPLPAIMNPVTHLALLLESGKHYFNEEPLYSSSFIIEDTVDRSKVLPLKWNSVSDPDSHAISYDIILCRDAAKYKPSGEMMLRVKDGNSYSNKKISYHKLITTTATNYSLDISECEYGEKINVYLKPHDKYYNNYYYANTLSTNASKDLTISLSIVDNMKTNDSRGLLCGDRGTIKFTYSHRKNLKATVKVYAYISSKNGEFKESGNYACTVLDITTPVDVGTHTREIDFNNFPELKRSRYVKYYAVVTDTNKVQSYIPIEKENSSMWDYAQGYHYFNGLPSAVNIFLAEDGDHALDDDIIDISWPKSVDVEDHSITYKLYIQADNLPDDNSPSLNKYEESFYIASKNTFETRQYAKVINLGSGNLPSNTNPYKLRVTEYIGKKISLWITTSDNYNAKYYLTGSKLDFNNPGVKPGVPVVSIEQCYAKDMYNKDKVDSENGYIRVTHTHPLGRSATVTLHAMVKSLVTGEIKIFKEIRSWNLTSGSSTGLEKINFVNKFGEVSRGSEIRYYATAMTSLGEYSEISGWEPTTAMYGKWSGTHKFNDEPSGVTITFNDAESDLHKNAVIQWPRAVDKDDTNPAKYSVAFAVDSDLKQDAIFYFGSNRANDEIRRVTNIWDTPNNKININLDGYDEGEKFKVWIVPHDDFANSYYYTSNTVEFTKAAYGKPIVTSTLNQQHSENGKISITYTHEDTRKKSDGTYESLDPDRSIANGDFNGTIDIYCYVNGQYTADYSVLSEKFNLGQTREFTIPFNKVSPIKRSSEIRYFVVATDNNPKMKSTNVKPSEANLIHLVDGFHYYNDEPFDTDIIAGDMDKQEDKFIYGFNYINLTWDSPYEPDEDSLVYYLYVDTPSSMGETKLQGSITSRTKVNNFTYSRKYRIREKYLSDYKTMGCEVAKLVNNEWVKIQDNSYVGIKINYLKDDAGKEWPVNGTYKMYLECRDHRTWNNSYYGFAMYESARKKHEPPNPVKLEVTPNLQDSGDGEVGKIKLLYTHPEGDIDAKVDVYAYQDGKYKNLVHSATYKNNVEQVIEIDFDTYEKKDGESNPNKQLLRSKNITYFAVATDTLVGMTSLDKYENIPLSLIPLLVPNEDGTYNKHIISANGKTYDFNKDNKYIGPVQIKEHYFNEEPPSTTPEVYDINLVPYNTIEIKWPHVKDPDNHEVSYDIYVASSNEAINTKNETFYNDSHIENPNVLIDESSENGEIDVQAQDANSPACGVMTYHKKVNIPASLAEKSSKRFSLDIAEYDEDSIVDLWIVSKDQYKNSYYRAGDILTANKGHKAKDIREVYPKNDSVVYSKTPRILIYLGEDSQTQTTFVGWKETIYNNKDHPEYFSDVPNTKNVIVFKPPTPYTTAHGTKVVFYVYSYNKSTYSEKKYITYTYKNFFESFVDDKLIPIKSVHINEFRKSCNTLRDTYGLETVKFTRDIKKNQIFENFDFNETKNSLVEINTKINKADPTPNLDYSNNLIIDIKDKDLVEYRGLIGASTYEEFLEWARLLYLLENM